MRIVRLTHGPIWFALVMAVAVPQSADAAGFRIYDQSASAAGQSDAFTAQADDASAVYYNPAGMTQVRRIQLSVGATLIGGSTSYRNAAGATTRGDFGGSVTYPPPVNFFFTANLRDLGVTALGNLSAGLAVTSPFGTLYEYPTTGPFATAVTRSAFELIDIKPTLAYKVNNLLSVGLGADIYTLFSFWGEGQYETHLISSGGPGLPPAGTSLEINGKNTAAGFNVSAMLTPLRTAEGKPRLNIGVVYRSQATLHLTGAFLGNGGRLADASTTLVLPTIYTGGMAYWPVRDKEREWKLEVDLDYTKWTSIRNLDLHLSTGTTIPFPQNWKSTATVMVGMEYKWLRPAGLPHWEIALRGGYWYSESPIPDPAYNPTVPDADNHSLSVGLGLLCKAGGMLLGLMNCGTADEHSLLPKGIGLDLAYKALLYETRTVSGNMNPVSLPGVVDGRYATTFHAGSINLRVDF